MACPLVRYSSRLTCRSNSRLAISDLGLLTGDPRADARHIVEDFINGVEPVIALEHDGVRSVTRERVIEEVEHTIGDRVGMGIGEERPPQNALAHGHAAGHM